MLDRRFEQQVARWPGVMAELLERATARAEALCVQLALSRIPSLEHRLLCLFWHLSERFGRVHTEYVTVSVPLSQETLAQLASASRPSVSGALRRLRDRGLLQQPQRGQWVLRGGVPSAADLGRAQQ